MGELIKVGQWVEIEMILIPKHSRISTIPEDTQNVDLTARIKGYLSDDAHIGDVVTVHTVLGREIQGTLLADNPPYAATFGAPVSELMNIGAELKEFLHEDEGEIEQ